MDLLVQVVPKMNRIAVLRNPANSASNLQLKQAEAAARSKGLQVQIVDVRTVEDVESAFASMVKARTMGVVVLPDASHMGMRQRIAELATKNRLPTVFNRVEMVEAGGLMSYGPSLADDFLRGGRYVDRILTGAKPAELPVEQASVIDLVVNLKTARALGLKIPQSVLTQATKVLE